MNPSNRVRLIGKIAREPKSGHGAKAAWAMASIHPDGMRSRVDVKAFKDAAETIATLGEGSRVRFEGHLEFEKPREAGGKWQLVVIVDEVHIERLVERPAQDAQALE